MCDSKAFASGVARRTAVNADGYVVQHLQELAVLLAICSQQEILHVSRNVSLGL